MAEAIREKMPVIVRKDGDLYGRVGYVQYLRGDDAIVYFNDPVEDDNGVVVAPAGEYTFAITDLEEAAE